MTNTDKSNKGSTKGNNSRENNSSPSIEKESTKTASSKKIPTKLNNIEKPNPKVFDELLEELISKKRNLTKEINLLEQKKSSLEKDIDSNFSGQSENIAKRVKGFQDYLSGALQHLSQSVEKLELVSQPIVVKPSPLDQKETKSESKTINVPALADTFKPDEEIIRKCFLSFTDQPDFYDEPWNLRRSLDTSDIEMLEDWFFNMGGRGSLESRGTRQKNALLTAGLIAILGELYGDQFQTLILASEPERLGEWRRILQDSLGLTREDFGPNSGIVLFERAEGVIERADRLEANNELPLIIIDGSENSVEIPILQFPLWLAFAGTSNEIYDDFNLD